MLLFAGFANTDTLKSIGLFIHCINIEFHKMECAHSAHLARLLAIRSSSAYSAS